MNSQNATVEQELDLLALLQIMWRWRWLVVGITAVFGIGSVVIALMTTPIYRAQAVVTEVRGDSVGGAAGGLLSQFGGLANLAGINLGGGADESRSAQAVLKSRHLAEEFVRRNKLIPEMFRESREKPSLWRAVEAFKQGVVTITDDVRAGKTTVAVEWRDPKLAASWANGYVALANELLRTRALDDANRNVAYLRSQINQTNVIEMQKVMYALVERETKTLMLANARNEYAFAVVDPAVVPELRVRPARTLMVITGGALGFTLGVIVALLLYFIGRVRTRAVAQGPIKS